MTAALALLLAGSLHVVAPSEPATGSAQEPDNPFLRVLKHTSRTMLLPTLQISAAFFPSTAWNVVGSAFNRWVPASHPVQQAQTRFAEMNRQNEPTFERWWFHVTNAPVFPDGNGAFVNFFVHPWVGAQIHLMYRRHGASFWQAFALNAMWAIVWEYVAESGTERPSLNDMMANICGALVGEAIFRLSLLIRKHMDEGTPREVLLTLLDPFGRAETLVLDVAEERLGMGRAVGWLR